MSKESPRPLQGDTDELKIMRDRFKLADESDQPQAQREKDDIAFEDGEQWETSVQLARRGQQSVNGSDPMPARPMVVVNKLKEPVRQILNGERASDLGLELVPAEDFGDLGVLPDDTEVTTREGLVRRIQRDSIASDARRWAFKRAVIAGRGFYMVMTRYLPGKTNDQEVYVHRIYRQDAVKIDPFHTEVDGSDAEWEFMGTWMPFEKLKAKHPKDFYGKKSPFSDASEQDFMAMAEDYPQFYQGGESADKERAVRIVDYYWRVYQPRDLATLTDGTVEWADEVADKDLIEDTRTVDDSKIMYRQVAGGVMVLCETEWPSPLMPIIKVIGDEVLPYDEQRRYNGVVRPARDSQVAENYMVSKFVETVGLTPINATYVDPDSIDGYEEQWKQANTRPGMPLPVRTYDDTGRQFNAPSRLPADPNILNTAQGIQLFDQMIQSTTGGSASDRVGAGKSVQSAKAINQLQQEDQFNTSNFLDNLARSAEYEAKVINSLLYPIYGARPGRLVRAMNGDGEMAHMVIQGDQPEGQQSPQPQTRGGKAPLVGKLTKDASFNVIIKITKNAENRRMQEATALGELIGAEPQLMTWFGDLYLNSSDIPQRKQLAKRAKAMLTPPIQAMLQAEDKGGTFDPVAQAENAKLKEQLQLAEQAMGELQKDASGERTKIEIAKADANRDIELERIKNTSAIELQRMKDATTIRVAEINAEVKGLVTGHAAAHESQALNLELAHDAAQAELDRQASAQAAEAQMAHQAASEAAGIGAQQDMTEADRQFQAEQSDADRQMTAEQAAQTEVDE